MLDRREFIQKLLIGTGTGAALLHSQMGHATKANMLNEQPDNTDQSFSAGLTNGQDTPFARKLQQPAAERSLNLYNIHTGESVNHIYWQEGQYIDDSLKQINILLRDFRSREVGDISRLLLDDLYQLQTIFQPKQPISIISGFRSVKTNAQLNKHSSGVAKKSLHMQGRAIDIRLPGIDIKQVQKAALAMRSGGVGIYSKSNFVHLDTGRVRRWGR